MSEIRYPEHKKREIFISVAPALTEFLLISRMLRDNSFITYTSQEFPQHRQRQGVRILRY